MSRWLAAGLVLLTAAAIGEEVHPVRLSQLQEMGCLAVGEVVPADSQTPFARLKVVAQGRGPTAVQVFRISHPAACPAGAALEGRLRHENVEGRAFLELRARFPDGSERVSRTDAPTGSARHLQGTSEWRCFSLPMARREDDRVPRDLTLDIRFAGEGTVFLAGLRLVQYEQGWQSFLRSPGAWPLWACAVVGAAGLHGLLFWLLSKGRALVFLRGFLALVLLCGALVSVVGLLALSGAVTAVPPVRTLALGSLLLLPALPALYVLTRTRREKELRRIKSMDVK